MYAAERHAQILDLLGRKKSVSVKELSDHFGVSLATIRSDLAALDREKRLVRTHGGAILRENAAGLSGRPASEDVPADRGFSAQKEKIAEAAMDFVEDGDYILLDSGSTTLSLAEKLVLTECRNLTVFSNDMAVLGVLEQNVYINLNILPGKIRCGHHYTYGSETVSALQSKHFSKVFLSASGVDEKNGITVVHPHLALLKRTMLRAGGTVILLSDSSKIGLTRFQKFADLKDIDVLITDSGIHEDDLSALEAGIGRVIVCP